MQKLQYGCKNIVGTRVLPCCHTLRCANGRLPNNMRTAAALVALLLASPAEAKSRYDAFEPAAPGTRVARVPTQADMQAGYEKRYGGPVLSAECDADPAAAAAADEPHHGANNVSSTDTGLHEIWLLPHTHDDVGWVWTVAAYFNNSVSDILDTVTADLTAHPDHRFIWSETKWLEMWWPLQNTSTQEAFKRLVFNGQLELVGAGWSQHDEVTPSYRDMIANTVTGAR